MNRGLAGPPVVRDGITGLGVLPLLTLRNRLGSNPTPDTESPGPAGQPRHSVEFVDALTG